MQIDVCSNDYLNKRGKTRGRNGSGLKELTQKGLDILHKNTRVGRYF